MPIRGIISSKKYILYDLNLFIYIILNSKYLLKNELHSKFNNN